MAKYQTDPTCCIFLKGGLFKDVKNGISMSQTRKYKIHKYSKTVYVEMSERPNMWYIFEESIVQGYLLNLAQLYKV